MAFRLTYLMLARVRQRVSALSALLDVHVLPSGGGTVTAATGAPTHPTGTTPSGDRHTPGDLLDLSRWYLTLPIADPSGRDDSGPWDVYQAELRTFNHPKYLRLVGDTVEYAAPVKGISTSSASGATRCELREMDCPGRQNKADWGFDDGKDHS